MRRIDFARANFNRNDKIIKIIFIDHFHHLVSNYQKLESEVASQLCSLEEKDLTISTHLYPGNKYPGQWVSQADFGVHNFKSRKINLWA